MHDYIFPSAHGETSDLFTGLGQEYLLNDFGALASGAAAQPVSGPAAHAAVAGSPLSTLVGTAAGLEIDLTWDASVRDASDWSALETAVTTAAKIFTSSFSNHAVINIAVGLGEIDGSALAAGNLGESESYGYIASYATTEAALASADGATLAAHGSSTHVLADRALSGDNFFLTSAQAKALNLVNPVSTGLDGFIGLTNVAGQLYVPGTGAAIKSTQYDVVGVAAHEISEVMGRLGMQGQTLGATNHVYTPLDLFRYASAGLPAVSPGNGYFSINGGASSLNTYNNPANGGDSADWASLSSNRTDAFDAFANPGVITNVTASDLLEVAVLGYQVAAGHTLSTVSA